MSDTFDRSQLDGKDREQLSEIASALGVKAISRMRKADLVDAIVAAAGGKRHHDAAEAAPDPFDEAGRRRPRRARGRTRSARGEGRGREPPTRWR